MQVPMRSQLVPKWPEVFAVGEQPPIGGQEVHRLSELELETAETDLERMGHRWVVVEPTGEGELAITWFGPGGFELSAEEEYEVARSYRDVKFN
jgi:hypothetical protein